MVKERAYVIGSVETVAGTVPRVSTILRRNDRWGTIKVRLTIGRMNYRVKPGLYAIGTPDADSPVFVSANFKLSFDILRSRLAGVNGWILVLDTRGINVWCAAGKGTFGTGELVGQIRGTRLPQIVRHRKLIVPQLGATGVAAHQVTKQTGFGVVYGPVRARDIKRFLADGMKATKEMRRVRFGFSDRAVLVPTEFVNGFKFLLIAGVVFFLLSGFSARSFSARVLLVNGAVSSLNLLLAYFAGTVLGPLLLPWLPGRAFSFKGIFPGLAFFGIAYLLTLIGGGAWNILAWLLIFTCISSFILMNFTGSSTYTSLKGVRREMRIAVPLQLVCFLAGFTLWLVDKFI
jgi:acetyl-CoA decarbonylase/synthase complex subunit gamma